MSAMRFETIYKVSLAGEKAFGFSKPEIAE